MLTTVPWSRIKTSDLAWFDLTRRLFEWSQVLADAIGFWKDRDTTIPNGSAIGAQLQRELRSILLTGPSWISWIVSIGGRSLISTFCKRATANLPNALCSRARVVVRFAEEAS